VSIDPLQLQVVNHQRDLRAAAQRRAIARSVRGSGRPAGLLRTTTAHLLVAAAARLEAPRPVHPLGDCA
jgi:hypothetical protein